MTPRRAAQSTVEYLLGASILAVAVALGFVAFGEAVRGLFDHAHSTAQLPYP